MLIVRGDAQTLPSELNKAATGEVWFDPIFPKTDGVDVGTVVFSPNGRTVWHQHEHGQLLQITSGFGFVCKEGEDPQRVRGGERLPARLGPSAAGGRAPMLSATPGGHRAASAAAARSDGLTGTSSRSLRITRPPCRTSRMARSARMSAAGSASVTIRSAR